MADKVDRIIKKTAEIPTSGSESAQKQVQVSKIELSSKLVIRLEVLEVTSPRHLKIFLAERQKDNKLDHFTPCCACICGVMNRTLMESAKAMLCHAGLPYWAEAIGTAAYLKNGVW